MYDSRGKGIGLHPMKQQTKAYIQKIYDKFKDPVTGRKRYTHKDMVLDDAVDYYYQQLIHTKKI
tara:strand:- start:296 stop:487 length:192 start_codon:yes stop_codon:yes gene_type:complete